jgi:Retrotransposon gag protein
MPPEETGTRTLRASVPCSKGPLPAQMPCHMTVEPTPDLHGRALDARAICALTPSIVRKSDIDHSSDQLMQMIHKAYQEAVGEATLPINISKMGIKIPIPKYAGETALADFERYITDLLWYFKIHQLLLVEHDCYRVQIMGTSLTGDVNEWFNHTVDTNDPSSPDWTFEEVVIAMKDRFVHHASAQDAANQYDGFSQSWRSVMEYYNMLHSYA